MKTKTTSLKTISCNVLLFLTAAQITYCLVRHFVYHKPYPTVLLILCCLFVATFASLKRAQYSKK